ncbi:hypothetical protein HDU82_002876 [Entophlyctis luteolus]|nr:hypothetical protein HDU82_002876 [Entophlyctis luteolus]
MVSGGRRKRAATSRLDSKDSDEFSGGSSYTPGASASTSNAAAQRELRKRRGSSLPKVATKRRLDMAADSTDAQQSDSSPTNPLLPMYFPNNPYQQPLLAPVAEELRHQHSEFSRIHTSYEGLDISHRISEPEQPLPIPVQFGNRSDDTVYLPQIQPTQQYFQQPPLLFSPATHPYEDPQRQQQLELHAPEIHRREGQQPSTFAMSTTYLESPRKVMQARWRVLETVNALSNAVREYNREELNDTGPDASDWREAANILRDAMESALAILRRSEAGGRSSGG